MIEFKKEFIVAVGMDKNAICCAVDEKLTDHCVNMVVPFWSSMYPIDTFCVATFANVAMNARSAATSVALYGTYD